MQALSWSWMHQQVCHFSSLLLLSESRLSLPPSFLLLQSLWKIWQELSSLSSCTIKLQLVPGHSFFPRNDAADKLAKRRALLILSAVPYSLSRLISHIHFSLFSDWRRTVSSKFFDTQVHSVFAEIHSLVTLAVCSLSSFATNKPKLLSL